MGKKAGDQYRALQSYGNSFQLYTEQERMVGGLCRIPNEKMSNRNGADRDHELPQILNVLILMYFSPSLTHTHPFVSKSSQLPFLLYSHFLLICNLPA